MPGPVVGRVDAVGGDEVVAILDSIGFLDFVPSAVRRALDKCAAETVEQAGSLSNGTEPILAVCLQAAEEMCRRTAGSLSIGECISQTLRGCIVGQFCRSRCHRIFELIFLYPESQPAVRELAQVLSERKAGRDDGQEGGSREDLLQLMLRSLRDKLLSAAVPTRTIIGQLLNGLSVFRQIDPTGLFYDRVGLEAKRYLEQHRSGELAPIVARFLVDFVDNYKSIPPRRLVFDPTDYDDYYVCHSEMLCGASGPDGREWLPDPPEAGSQPVRPSSKRGDLLGVLVNFTNYQSLFDSIRLIYRGELIGRVDGNADADSPPPTDAGLGRLGRRLEVLSTILLDAKDANRLRVMLEDARGSGTVSPTGLIISSHFWPEMGPLDSRPDAIIPEALVSSLAERFVRARPGRRLLWLNEQCSASIEIVFSDALSYAFSRVPLPAFKSLLRLQKGPARIHGESQDFLLGLAYWSERGMIELAEDRIVLVRPVRGRPVDSGLLLSHVKHMRPEEAPSATDIPPGPGRREAEPRMPAHLPAMITAMLTNLGGMQIARMHAMLCTLSATKVTVEELSCWLGERVEQGHLRLDPLSSEYLLVKK